MNYLSLDIGTTRCKCQLFSEAGEILAYRAEECPLVEREGERYVDIEEIIKRVKGLIAYAASVAPVSSVCVSSFGEAFVLLGERDEVLFPPIPFTDLRGFQEAEEIAALGADELYARSGVMPHAMFSVSKLLWLKRCRPELFARAKKVMLICDYIGYLLTGERVIDYALASRTGAFDLAARAFDSGLLCKFSIDPALFSSPAEAGSRVGRLRPALAEELGVCVDCVLVLGSHDQVCTAVGAGVLSVGEVVDGLGTAECMTAVFDRPLPARLGSKGYCTVPYPGGLYCSYLFGNSCGGLIDWLRKEIMHGYCGEEKSFFSYIERGMKDAPTEILCLPYFAGAGTPYHDPAAKGAFINLTSAVTDSDLYKSVLEGLAMEMRLNMEEIAAFGIPVRQAVATGGGANSGNWLQLKADIQNIPMRSLRSSEGGLCGCAILQAAASGAASGVREAAEIFVRYGREYLPDARRHAAYEEQYQKYKTLYATLKELRL